MITAMQIFFVTVTGYGSGGEGVARLGDGRVVFIRGAARGDVLAVALHKEYHRSARAEIVKIVTSSPYRVKPDCPVFPACGGCDFWHVSYEEELRAKLQKVNDALARVGGLSVRVSNILQTGRTVGYRNKATLHSDGAAQGFFAAKSRRIIPIDSCLLLKDDINGALKHRFSSGEKVLRSGRNGLAPPLEEELDGLVFGISGFFQVNTGAALLLYQKAREYAALSKHEVVVDLYCGVGSLTLFVGRDAGRAVGVELNRASVDAARANALRNSMPHVEFICADAADWNGEGMQPDCLMVDPPRRGLTPDVIRKLLELKPGRIVYVSCDPATLARDIKMLEGYMVRDICAVDMFPRTANVECCCLLVKK